MKIIELLYRIAFNEEVPKKFRYEDLIITRDRAGNYLDNEGDMFTDSILSDLSNLNDEVEVIEEDKKIEKIKLCKVEDSTICGLSKSINVLNQDIEDKINEIIDILNKNNITLEQLTGIENE